MDQIYTVLSVVVMVVLGGLSIWLKCNKTLVTKATGLIAEAEENYKDTTKAGGEKFAWVVDTLYTYIPLPLKIILPKAMVEQIVQNTFDAIEDYATIQLDKLVNKITNTKE